uniref:HAT C-terminal dimerisation domain-containing protein n=1 Tax=Rhodnius prolixus TaxID=13249 RepID=T1HNF9_RHOPR
MDSRRIKICGPVVNCQPFQTMFAHYKADSEVVNCVEFLSKEMPDIKIDDNCLFEEIRRLNIYLNSDKLEQWENQHVEIDKRWVEIFNHFKNEHIPYENLVIPVEFTLCCPGTNAAVERVFSMGNDFWLSEKSRLNVDTLAAALTVVEVGDKSSTLEQWWSYADSALYEEKNEATVWNLFWSIILKYIIEGTRDPGASIFKLELLQGPAGLRITLTQGITHHREAQEASTKGKSKPVGNYTQSLSNMVRNNKGKFPVSRDGRNFGKLRLESKWI